MKKHLLIAAGLTVLFGANAQELMPGYVTWPSGENLATNISQWNGGTGTLMVDNKAWEDEEFFISRVKPRTRFYNNATQVYPSITQYDATTNPNGNDKRMIWWVPIGNEMRNNCKTNCLPNGVMDQEVFSMWSYMDHFGNWNSPWGWCPAALADVAHKNGVAVSGVSSVPFGSISAGWSSAYALMRNVQPADVGKFLYYHGVDGLGYNSEFSCGTTTVDGLRNLHDGLTSYMADKNPIFENMWYAGTNDLGNINFDSGIANFMNLFKGASMFLNYNWNDTGVMSRSVANAKNAGKSPFYIYAGMNAQGGEPKSGENYPILKNYQYSIGIWGAHSTNMFWLDRNAKGSAPATMQRTYTNTCEMWFGNGPRNPAIKKEITTVRAHRPNENWAGQSSMMSARSVLAWDLKDEPFYTSFNLGNGTFLNWRGNRQLNKEWYNIGVQDMLPTWRWWFAPTFLQKDVQEGTTHLAADFTWADAWNGGSCLQISGTTDTEYLHLFKTHFTMPGANTKFTVTYKLLEGEADINLVVSTEGTESVMVHEGTNGTAPNREKWRMSLLSVAESVDAQDQSYNQGADGWVTKTFSFNSTAINVLGGKPIEMVALEIKNARNLKLLLGEFGISAGRSATAFKDYGTPATPELKTAKILVNNYAGLDAKLTWSMANSKEVGLPVYNSDVKTSLFHMWLQQEGQEPQMTGMTTSWAGIMFQVPTNPQAPKRVRVGVSAVGIDFRSESEVAWSDYMDMGQYTTVDNIQINKNVIKPGETFTLGFTDPLHDVATWSVKHADTDQVHYTGSGHTVELSLPETGQYTVTATWGDGQTKEFNRFIPISGLNVGALPEIKSLTFGEAAAQGDIAVELNQPNTFGYTGREADGQASRGIDLRENWFGVNVGQLGIQAYNSFSVAAWVKYNEIPQGKSNFITIEDRQTGGWPYNNWGFFWSRITPEGKFVHPNIDTSWGMRTGAGTEGRRLFYRYDDAKVDVNAWTHVAIVFEHNPANSQQLRQKFYINGRQQRCGAWVDILKSTAEGLVGSTGGDWTDFEKMATRAYASGFDTYEPGWATTERPIDSKDWIAFGGSANETNAVQGCVDDFQVWGKAMTAEEVVASMNGLDANNLPADVLGYWDLESEAVGSNHAFVGKAGANATNQAPEAFWYTMNTGEGEGAGMFNFDGEPSFLSGCPFISGTAFPIVTKPTWVARRSTVVGDGSDKQGSARITFNREGDYEVTLSLTNDHGTDTQTYPVVSVIDASQGAIGGVAADAENMAVYTIDHTMFVEFGVAGDYTIDVYNMTGVLASQTALSAEAGQNATLSIAQSGVYVVNVLNAGKLVRTFKVIVK